MPLIKDFAAEIIEVPLRHAFVTAQDKLARQVSRPAVISLMLDDGRIAVGEAVPVQYVTGETQESVIRDVEAAAPALLDGDITRLDPLIRAIREALPHSPTACAGIETALYNGLSLATGIPLWRLLGGATDRVESDLTLSIVADAPERAREAVAAGFRYLKVKVGGPDPAEDLARLRQIHRAAPEAILRLDANQGFSVNSALRFVEGVIEAGIPLQLVEQPVPKEDLAALDRIAADSPVPIFADEAVKSPADALRVLTSTRVQGINVKVMKAGIAGALDIVAVTRAAGRRLMIGCMLETRRGIASSLAVACGTGAFEFVDLDSHVLLREAGDNPYFRQDGGMLTISDR